MDRTQIADLDIHWTAHTIYRDGERIKLNPTEWKLLSVLVEHSGQTLTSTQLITAVWGETYLGSNQLLQEYIRRLRRKIKDSPRQPRYVWTVPCIGYRFEYAT